MNLNAFSSQVFINLLVVIHAGEIKLRRPAANG